MAPVKRVANKPRKTCVRMVMEAIMALKDRQGSSPKDIRRYIESKYRKDFQGNREAIAQKVTMALRLGANTGVLAQKHGNPDRWVLGDRCAANRQRPKSRSGSKKRRSSGKSCGRRRRRGRRGKKGKGKGKGRRRRRRRGRRGKKGKKGKGRRRRGRRGRRGRKGKKGRR